MAYILGTHVSVESVQQFGQLNRMKVAIHGFVWTHCSKDFAVYMWTDIYNKPLKKSD